MLVVLVVVPASSAQVVLAPCTSTGTTAANSLQQPCCSMRVSGPLEETVRCTDGPAGCGGTLHKHTSCETCQQPSSTPAAAHQSAAGAASPWRGDCQLQRGASRHHHKAGSSLLCAALPHAAVMERREPVTSSRHAEAVCKSGLQQSPCAGEFTLKGTYRAWQQRTCSSAVV